MRKSGPRMDSTPWKREETKAVMAGWLHNEAAGGWARTPVCTQQGPGGKDGEGHIDGRVWGGKTTLCILCSGPEAFQFLSHTLGSMTD